MSFLFLSHSSNDDELAGRLRDWLEQEGHQALFVDHHAQDGIIGGQLWEERLYTELRRCRALLALVSPAWLASPWCIAEANHAQALRKIVIPLRVADIEPETYARKAPPVLQRVQAINWQTGEEARARLREALVRAGLDPKRLFVWEGDRAPYPGLAAFSAADAPVYFGREQEITDLLGILDGCRAPGRARLVIVQGASGTGKSSLIRAGVLPRLERDPDRWLVVPPFRPLRQPLPELANALIVASDAALTAPPSDRADGSTDQIAWARWVRDALDHLRVHNKRLDATVLLTVDQLEEALSGPGGAGDALLLTLRDVLAAADHRVLVLATLRADFTGTLQRHPALREPPPTSDILLTQAFQLGPMPRSSFHAIIEGPAALVGLEFEPGLVSQLVDEARTDDALPLLAFVLRELWDTYGKKDLKLTRKRYDDFGGLENAVGDRAEQIFKELAPGDSEVEAFRVTLLFGMADLSADGRIVRRRLPLVEVPDTARRLIEEFASPRARLLYKSTDFVEVAHEALFRRWSTLTNWIESARDDFQKRRRVMDAFEAWNNETGDKSSRLLPPGLPLEEARDLIAKPRVLAEPTVLEFVSLSIRADTKRKRQRRMQVVAVAAVLLIAAIASGLFGLRASTQAEIAESQRRLAVARLVATQARDAAERVIQGQSDDEEGRELAMLGAESLVRLPAEEAASLAIPLALASLDLASSDSNLYDVIPLEHRGSVATLGFSDGLRLIDRTGTTLLHVSGDDLGCSNGGCPHLDFVGVSSDERHIAVQASGGDVYVVDTASGDSLKVTSTEEFHGSFALDPDGIHFAAMKRTYSTGDDTGVLVGTIDETTKTFTALHSRMAAPDAPEGLFFAGSNKLIVETASTLTSINVADRTAKVLFQRPDHSLTISETATTATSIFLTLQKVDDDFDLPSLDGDATEAQEDIDDKQDSLPIGLYRVEIGTGHTDRVVKGNVYGVSVSPDHRLLAVLTTKDSANRVKFLSIPDLGEVFSDSLPSVDMTFGPAWSPDGRWFATGADDSSIVLVDLIKGDTTVFPSADRILFSSNPTRTVLVGEDGIQFIDLTRMQVIYNWIVYVGRFPEKTVALSHDGRLVTFATDAGLLIGRLEPSELRSWFCERYELDMSTEEWERLFGNEAWRPTCLADSDVSGESWIGHIAGYVIASFHPE